MANNYWIQPEDLDNYANTEFADEACKVATYLLWAMSGRKFSGVTTVTERYTCVLRNNRMGPSTKTNSAVLFGGDVYNIPSGDYDEYSELVADGLSPDARIKLRGRPVTQIHAIRNRNGVVIDPSNYYLVDHSTIHIKAGTPWTPCNTEVTYSYGTPVPIAGRMAAKTLALEFAKLWAGDDDCALPQRVTSVSRQGVSYTILDNQEFIAELRTGLYAVDLFLKVANPDNARRRSKVFSPDQPRARRYNPKTVKLTANVEYDLVSTKGAAATWDSADAASSDVTIFFDEAGWEPKLSVYNYGETKSADVSAGNITVDSGAETVSFSIPYTTINSILGMVDPGIWTLYATKTIDGVENVSELASGNLQVKMYS